MRTLIAALVLFSTLSLHLSSCFAQGPLAPPGAPTPAMKTLNQLEPRTPISAALFVISASGSYYVTGNLTSIAGQPGISINADNVTLDLGGFELVPVAGGPNSGVRVLNFHVNVTINDRGIEVSSTGSLIIKNSAASTTTDYAIAASNRYGPIINITAAGAAAVNGNTAASTVASTDPWANFSY